MTSYFCLNIDTEADFYYLVPSPHINGPEFLKWKVNRLLGKMYKYPKGRDGLKNVVNLLKTIKFPATFNIAGHLYLKSCNGYPHFNEEKPNAEWFFKKDWYYWDKPSNFKKSPGLYLGDFIEEQMLVPYFDLGLHSFSHEVYPFENRKFIKNSLDASIKSAKEIGVKLKTFSAPCNIIEEVSEPSKVYDILKEKGFKGTLFMGIDDKTKLKGYNAHKYHKKDIKPIFNRQGFPCIQVSNFIEGTSSGNSSNLHVKKIIEDIKNNKDNNIFLLSTHDFTHKNINNLKNILNWVIKHKKENNIEILNLSQCFERKNEFN